MTQVEAYFTHRLTITLVRQLECGHTVAQRSNPGMPRREVGEQILCSSCMVFRTITALSVKNN